MTDTEKIIFPASWKDRGATRTFTPPAKMIYARQIQVLLKENKINKGLERVLSYDLYEEGKPIAEEARKVISKRLPQGLTRGPDNTWYYDEYYQCLLPYELAVQVAAMFKYPLAMQIVEASSKVSKKSSYKGRTTKSGYPYLIDFRKHMSLPKMTSKERYSLWDKDQ